jgi:CMP-N-acetylneuraminic acid synthetase
MGPFFVLVFALHLKFVSVLKIFFDFYLHNGKDFSLRQNIPKYYHRNGICYACTRNYLLNTASIINHNTAAVVIPREVVNIDTFEDLNYANYLYVSVPKNRTV